MLHPPPQYLPSPQQYQEPNEDYPILKNHHPKQTLVVYNHLSTPMAPTLGHPNRSCASCKKRKVKCDRKTPSCTACLKSRYKCLYTSYSPPVYTGSDPQIINDDERGIRDYAKCLFFALQQQQQQQQQQTLIPKQQESYYVEDEIFSNFNLSNPMITPPSKNILPTTPVEQHHPRQQFSSPPTHHHHHHHQQVQQEFYQSPAASYPMSSPPQYQHNHAQPQSPFITQNVMVQQVTGNYVPYMRATVTLNYNFNGMHQLLNPSVLPYIQSMTNNNSNEVPPTGFTDIDDLQEWLKNKFIEQEWNYGIDNIIDPDEKIDILDSHQQNVIQQNILQQKFTVILYKPDYYSSPVSPCNGDHDDFEHSQYGGDDENTDVDSHASYNSRGSNRSSMVVEIDHTDIFLNKVYAFVRRFIKNVPWLRENFFPRTRDYEAAFSDVVVEVRKNNPTSSTPYLNRKFNHYNNNNVSFNFNNNQQIPDEIVAKGRMFI